MSPTCTCGSEVPGSHEADCPSYTPPWRPNVGDRVRSVESGNDAIVTKISDSGWLTLKFVQGHSAVARASDVYLVEPAQ